MIEFENYFHLQGLSLKTTVIVIVKDRDSLVRIGELLPSAGSPLEGHCHC